METTQTFINRLMVKQNMLNPYNGKLLDNKRNEVLVHVTLWVDFQNIILSKRSQTQGPHIIRSHSHEVFRKGKFIERQKTNL